MVCGPQEETSEQAVNPTAILQAMQTAIAPGAKGSKRSATGIAA